MYYTHGREREKEDDDVSQNHLNHSKTTEGVDLPDFRHFRVKIIPKLTLVGYLSTEAHLRMKNRLFPSVSLEDFFPSVRFLPAYANEAQVGPG